MDLDLDNLPLLHGWEYTTANRSIYVQPAADPLFPYGPESDRVQAIIDALPALNRKQMADMFAVVKSAGDRDNWPAVYDRAEVLAAVASSRRRAEFLAAWWDAAALGAGTWANDEFFWQDAHHGGATQCAMLAARVQVVADLVAPETLAAAQAPWRAAFEGLPAGLLGPRQATIEAMATRFASLTTSDALTMADAWYAATGGQSTGPYERYWRLCREVNDLRLDLVTGLFRSPSFSNAFLSSARPGRDLGVEIRYLTGAALLAVAFDDHLPRDLHHVMLAGWRAVVGHDNLSHESTYPTLGRIPG
jgi:hypothetical protein